MSSSESPKPTEKKNEEAQKATVPSMIPETPTVMDQGESGPTTPSSPTFEIGQLLGKYELRNKLGQGGMGAVYLAFDPMIEREVAIKMLPPEVATNQQLLERFLTEARSTGKLNHPNVVGIYDIGQQDSTYYIVMELLTGGSLADFRLGTDSDAWKEVCEIVAQAADGLAAAHSKGLIHRDIKPDNLMRSELGVVKVVDFGLSKLLDAANDTRAALTKDGQILGTPQYMSPEQFQGKKVDFRADIYALGGTLFCLLTNRLPYQDSATIIEVMYAHLEQPPPDPCLINSNFPSGLREIVARAMAKSAENRYQNAAEMAADLRALISSASNSESPASETPVLAVRPLKSALIVEPAKLPAMMLKNTLAKAGAESITICQQAAEALDAIRETPSPPDVLITALQLKDRSGRDLLSQLGREAQLKETLFVLNSSDCSPEVLRSSEKDEFFAVIAKTAKPDELLRLVHVCSGLEIQSKSLNSVLEAGAVRTVVCCDTARFPDRLGELIRQAGLFNLDVVSNTKEGQLDFPHQIGESELLLLVQTERSQNQSQADIVELISQSSELKGTIAVLQANARSIHLRAVRREAFSAVIDLPLDEPRLTRLLEITQS